MESQSQSKSVQCHVNFDYIRTLPGILKIIELVLTIIAFGCAAHVSDKGWGSQGSGYGWVSFVTISGFLQALVSLILHILLSTNWGWSHLAEVIIYAVWSVLLLIAGIVGAALARGDGTAGAATAFTFFSFGAWVVDTLLQAKDMRFTFTSGTTTTTTTTTTASNPDPAHRFEGNPQY